MKLKISLAAALLSTALPAAAQEAPSPAFTDATLTNVPQDAGLHALDAAMLDVDADGNLDVAVAVEYGVNRLYLNDGSGKLSWQPGAFGNIVHDSEHVETADLNRDGRPDLVFVSEDDGYHQLFLGGADGRFTDASDRLPKGGEGNALAIGDVNKDGLPDIVIGRSDEKGRGGAQNLLLFNDPDRPGHFRDVTGTHLPKSDRGTQGIALADLDGDGDLDMVVANQDPGNQLLLNDGSGRFSDASDRLDLPVPLETREVHVFDADRDGLPDILFSNITSNNHGWDKDPQTRLLINTGGARFRDETAKRLPQHRFSSWGAEVIDFDGDGAPDLMVGAIQVPGFVPLQMRAWRNDGQGRFSDVTLPWVPSATVGRHWSMARGDLDGDRKDDLFVGQWETQARLLLTNKAAIPEPPLPTLGEPPAGAAGGR